MAQETILHSNPQSRAVYGAVGAPRQRHAFSVHFVTPNQNPDQGGYKDLVFVVKHCDRPKVTVKTEQLNQYNKTRQVYTGFKYEPMRITFYDSADGTAQNMWARYAAYYFGDFAANKDSGYGYDVTLSQYVGAGDYGLLGNYANGADQWFFSEISIYHYYNNGGTHLCDQYKLVNPRITSFEPDELDYENTNVSQINMQLVYENLQYIQGQSVAAIGLTEFQDKFAGPDLQNSRYANLTSSINTASGNVPPANPISPVSVFGSSAQTASAAAPYRTTSAGSSGALSQFGNFIFGGNANGGLTQILPTAGLASLSPATFGNLNAAQTGTAQYGVNAPAGGPIDAGSFDTSA